MWPADPAAARPRGFARLMRLAHASGGEATLGGIPLCCVSRQDIGRLVGYVGQNPFVFAGTDRREHCLRIRAGDR